MYILHYLDNWKNIEVEIKIAFLLSGYLHSSVFPISEDCSWNHNSFKLRAVVAVSPPFPCMVTEVLFPAHLVLQIDRPLQGTRHLSLWLVLLLCLLSKHTQLQAAWSQLFVVPCTHALQHLGPLCWKGRCRAASHYLTQRSGRGGFLPHCPSLASDSGISVLVLWRYLVQN